MQTPARETHPCPTLCSAALSALRTYLTTAPRLTHLCSAAHTPQPHPASPISALLHSPLSAHAPQPHPGQTSIRHACLAFGEAASANSAKPAWRRYSHLTPVGDPEPELRGLHSDGTSPRCPRVTCQATRGGSRTHSKATAHMIHTCTVLRHMRSTWHTRKPRAARYCCGGNSHLPVAEL